MSWPLRLIPLPVTDVDWIKVQLGDCWYDPEYVNMDKKFPVCNPKQPELKSRFRPGLNRPPIMVRLPGGTDFCIDTITFSRDQGGWYGQGWSVTGEPPAITLLPSINIVGSYHGYITNGVITDDCEGRQFV